MDKHIGSAISLFVILLALMGFILVAPIGIAIYSSWQPEFTGVIVYGMVLIIGLIMVTVTIAITTVISFGIYRRMKYSVDREHERNWLMTQIFKEQNRLSNRQNGSGQQPIFPPPIDGDDIKFDLIKGQDISQWIK